MTDRPINLGEVLLRGMLAAVEEEKARTWLERGRLRGGSVGLLRESDGAPLSGCPRQALARFLGAEPPRNAVEWAVNHLMLDAGNGSELLWAKDLAKGIGRGLGVAGLERARLHVNKDGGNDYHIEWWLEDPRGGPPTRGTGREDLALVSDGGAGGSPNVLLLCELKMVASISTAHTVLLKRQPKLDHLVQACNYALRAGAPVQIWYAGRTKLPYASKEWPYLREHEYGPTDLSESDLGRFSLFLERTGKTYRSKLKQILPFLVGYQVGWTEDGFATYQCLLPDGPLGEPTVSPVRLDRIDAHYQAVLSQEASAELHPIRPKATDANGHVHGRFSLCNYCGWKSTCDRADRAADKGEAYRIWREGVDAQAEEGRALAERLYPTEEGDH